MSCMRTGGFRAGSRRRGCGRCPRPRPPSPRLPSLITRHGSDLRLALGSPLGKRLFRAVAARASAITAVSSWLARGAADIGGGSAPVVAPMPVLTNLFFPDHTREPQRLLFVGKLSPQKGLDRLLRA